MVENPPLNINKLPLAHLFCPPRIPILPEGKLQDRMPPTRTGAPTQTCLLSIIVPNNKHCMQSCIQLLASRSQTLTPRLHPRKLPGKWQRKTNHLKMYHLLKENWWFSIAILIFGRVNLFEQQFNRDRWCKTPTMMRPATFFSGNLFLKKYWDLEMTWTLPHILRHQNKVPGK